MGYGAGEGTGHGYAGAWWGGAIEGRRIFHGRKGEGHTISVDVVFSPALTNAKNKIKTNTRCYRFFLVPGSFDWWSPRVLGLGAGVAAPSLTARQLAWSCCCCC